MSLAADAPSLPGPVVSSCHSSGLQLRKPSLRLSRNRAESTRRPFSRWSGNIPRAAPYASSPRKRVHPAKRTDSPPMPHRLSVVCSSNVLAVLAALFVVGCASGGTGDDGLAMADTGTPFDGARAPTSTTDASTASSGEAGIDPEGGPNSSTDGTAPSDAASLGADAATGEGGTEAGATDADVTASDAAADTGAHPPDAGTVTDPFDPGSCPGAPLTQAQAAKFFQAGATQAIIGSYTLEMRKRACNAVTGCGAWGAPTTTIGLTLGQLGADRTLSGQILLNVQGTGITLSLVDSTEELPDSMGATCGAVAATPLQCTEYEYDLGDQWGGSGGLYPTLIQVIDANGKNVTLGGVLTSTCLRLAYAAIDSSSNTVQEFVILSPVAPGPPPPPNPGPGGGTPMACGGQAPGQMTCCQNGLTTCPSSGCDCWGACE